MTRAACLLLLVAGVASADVWERAQYHGGADPAREVYEQLLRAGDEQATLANSRSSDRKTIETRISDAIARYRQAATAKPEEAEPYFRIGKVLFSFYFDCDFETQYPRGGSLLCSGDPKAFKASIAKDTIAAWDAFEARAPLDPRVTDLLLERAILHTKLVTREHLEAATRDYRKLLDRSDSNWATETVTSNLAETYMMLGRADEAIELYKEAIARGAGPDAGYGLAVALDRDERGYEALDEIVAQGAESVTKFRENVLVYHRTFFVPAGEEFYYFALISEAWNMPQDALYYWREYIASGAHPEFQPRARKHIELLMQRVRGEPEPSPSLRALPEPRPVAVPQPHPLLRPPHRAPQP
jgi:tetratricopeptide (TPR) repeat protein